MSAQLIDRFLRGPVWTLPLLLCIDLLAASGTGDESVYLTARAVPQAPVLAPAADTTLPEVTAIAQDISERFHVPDEEAMVITREAFRAARDHHNVKPTLVLAIVEVESSYRPTAINKHSGAAGLMQVLPKWHPEKIRDVGGEQMLLTVAPNIHVGTAIIAEYLEREGGRLDPALGRYSGSAQAEQYVRRVREQMRHFSRVAQRAEEFPAMTLIAAAAPARL